MLGPSRQTIAGIGHQHGRGGEALLSVGDFIFALAVAHQHDLTDEIEGRAAFIGAPQIADEFAHFALGPRIGPLIARHFEAALAHQHASEVEDLRDKSNRLFAKSHPAAPLFSLGRIVTGAKAKRNPRKAQRSSSFRSVAETSRLS